MSKSKKKPIAISLVGAPCCGKGYVKKHVQSQKGDKIHTIGMSDLLRNGDSEVKKMMAEGVLVPDDIIFSLFEEHVIKHAPRRILFEGIPRNENQAHWVENFFQKIGYEIHHIDISVPDNVLYSRFEKRLQSEQRPDDTLEVYQRRLKEWKVNRFEILKPLSCVICADGTYGMDTVVETVFKAFKVA